VIFEQRQPDFFGSIAPSAAVSKPSFKMMGRNEIFTYHDGLHKGVFKERTLTARWKDLRFIGADVAIGHIAFAGRASSGDERRNTTALATVVLVKQQGRWLIAAFHNTFLENQYGSTFRAG
jgi:uncharacterized protein (TIGR02246 family)